VNSASLARLVFIEAPTARLPLAVLFIDVLHNGAVAFHVHGTLGRLLANIFIWIILVVGGGFVVFFRDWVFGFAIAYHTLSLALEQLAIKVIALQWIFGKLPSHVSCFSFVGLSRLMDSVRYLWDCRVVVHFRVDSAI
jgi:hypothetical protein